MKRRRVRWLAALSAVALPGMAGNAADAVERDIQLNIDQKTIERADLEEGVELRTGPDSPWMVRVGGSVRARKVRIQLRNVRGRLRFSANPEALPLRLRPVAEPERPE